jgi:hypothetical protein
VSFRQLLGATEKDWDETEFRILGSNRTPSGHKPAALSLHHPAQFRNIGNSLPAYAVSFYMCWKRGVKHADCLPFAALSLILM